MADGGWCGKGTDKVCGAKERLGGRREGEGLGEEGGAEAVEVGERVRVCGEEGWLVGCEGCVCR